jgi:hypothetical protein
LKQIDYGKLLPGDIIGSTGSIFDPVSCLIRGTTAGIDHALDPTIASHVFVVCKEHDLLYGMSMDLNGLSQDDLNTWEHGVFGDHIVFVARPFEWDNYALQDKINQWLLKSHEIGIKYDVLELLRWWGLPVYDDPKKIVCGDFTRIMLQTFGLAHPKEWDVDFRKSDPWDQQAYFTNAKKLINWWK